MSRRRVGAAVIVAAWASSGCRATDSSQAQAGATSLASTLETAIAATTPNREAIVARWRLDRDGWARSTVAPYTAAYAAYAQAFDLASPRWLEVLKRGGEVTTRAQYAGDPRLTVGQARARWAVPVQHPAEVAELDGAPLDAVFVRDGDGWRAIVGIDAIVQAAVATRDPACAAHLGWVRTGRCGDVGWLIADSALRGDASKFAHACRLADNLCPK